MGTIDFQAYYSDADNKSVYTFSDCDFGSIDSYRYIIVSINSRCAGSTPVLTSVTIGGWASTLTVNTHHKTHTSLSALAIAKVPSGTTGDVVLTFNKEMVRAHIGIYRATNVTLTEYDKAESDAYNPSVSLDVPVGFAIGVATPGNGTSTWTGLTETYDVIVEAALGCTSAMTEFEAEEDARTISINYANSFGEDAALFMSWEYVEPGGAGGGGGNLNVIGNIEMGSGG